MKTDNTETSPEIIESRGRAGDSQATINIELALTTSAAGDVQRGGVLQGDLGGGVIGDITLGVRDPRVSVFTIPE